MNTESQKISFWVTATEGKVRKIHCGLLGQSYHVCCFSLGHIISQGFHGIPCVKEQLDSQSLLNTETLWILSTILPSCFIGNVTQSSNSAEQQKITSDEKKPLEMVGFCLCTVNVVVRCLK